MRDKLDIPQKDYTYEYERKSVTQADRLSPSLSREYVGLDERSFEDLLQQMMAYAKNVAYYDETTSKTISENKETWESFFMDKEVMDKEVMLTMEKIESKMSKGEVEPQLALMLAFLKLYQIEQDNFNNLLTRYHDFYYEDILGFSPQKGHMGRVVVFPSIEKQVESALIPKGTLLDAGKGINGKPLYYAACEDFSVNQVKVSDCVAYNNLDGMSGDKPYFQPICGTDTALLSSDTSALSDKYSIAISSERFLGHDGYMSVVFKGLSLKKQEEPASHDGTDNNAQNETGLFDLGDFDAEYTGEKGWVHLDPESFSYVDENITCLGVKIDQNKTPIAIYDKKVHGDGYEVETPIVRINVRNAKSMQKMTKNCFKDIRLEVEGSQNVIIENKFGLVENRTGAMAFGAMCAEGDSFRIKAPMEDAQINSRKAEFTLDYFFGTEIPSEFLPEAHEYCWCPSLYSATYVLKAATLTIDDNAESVVINNKELKNERRPCNIVLAGDEYKLTHDYFNQQANAVRLAKSAIDYQKSSWVGITDFLLSIPMLNQPIVIDYSYKLKEEDFQLYPGTPFGVEGDAMESEEQRTSTGAGESENENIFGLSSEMDMGESYLQIGLEGVSKACEVSLYFRIKSYVLAGHYSPRWYYISGDKWTKMDGDILKDTTNNFRKSGCVTLSLSEEVVSSSLKQECFPKGKVWLKLNFKMMDNAEDLDYEDLDKKGRMSVNKQGGNCKTRFDFTAIEEVRAQGMEVEYYEDSVGKLPRGAVLNAGSIKKLVSGINGVKKIEQPYDGEMGREDETEMQFRSRVGERLRHKGKAWTGWDYERLVLENFPQISAAKYFPCRNLEGKYQAGHVYVSLAPNPQFIKQENPLKPQIGADLLYDIYQCVREHATTFAQQEFHVKELDYVEVRVNCEIYLKEGLVGADYYETLINQELVKFIAPWSDNIQIVDFSREIKKKDILYFIENMEFVDRVEAMLDYVPEKREDLIEVGFEGDNEEVIRRYDSDVTKILTSVNKHNLKVLLNTAKG